MPLVPYAPRVKHPYYICTLDDLPQYYWHDNVFLGFVQVIGSWETWVRATEESRWQFEVRFLWDVSTKGSKLGGKWDLNSNLSGKFLFCPWKGFKGLTCTRFENILKQLQTFSSIGNIGKNYETFANYICIAKVTVHCIGQNTVLQTQQGSKVCKAFMA